MTHYSSSDKENKDACLSLTKKAKIDGTGFWKLILIFVLKKQGASLRLIIIPVNQKKGEKNQSEPQKFTQAQNTLKLWLPDYGSYYFSFTFF